MDMDAMRQRYDDPVRLSLTPPPSGAWDPEQLFVPELQAQKLGKEQMFDKYDEHLTQRQNQVKFSTGPDRDRAQLMYNAETTGMQRYVSEDLAQGAHPTSVAALELRQDKLMHQRSMAELVTYDRQHQHPMHDQSRHPDKPASLDEKRQWSERDGRQTTHDELVSFGQQGGFNLFRHRVPESATQGQQNPESSAHHSGDRKPSDLWVKIKEREQQREKASAQSHSPSSGREPSEAYRSLKQRQAKTPPVQAQEQQRSQSMGW